MQTQSRVYDSYAQAEQTVRALEQAGVPAGDISIIANRNVSERHADVTDASAAASGAGLGAAMGGGAGLLAGLGLLAIPGLGPVVAAGWFAATVVGAAAGTAAGGLIGALVDAGTSESDAHVYSESIRRGGTMVVVRTDASTTLVRDILDRHQPIDAAARRREYEAAGWRQFDPDAPPYRPDQTEIDRMRRRD
jgi:hypothetical protein